MAELFYIDFDEKTLNLDICFRQSDILEQIRKSAPEDTSLPKIDTVYDTLYMPGAFPDRPYTVSSIVLSADGKMAFTDNPAGPVIAKNNFFDPDGALADFWILNAIRCYCDGIIMGARTLQTEANNTSHIFDAELFSQRGELFGKSEHPHNIIVSFDGTDIPLDHLIFTIDKEQHFHVVIATSPSGGDYLVKQGDSRIRLFGPFNRKGTEAPGTGTEQAGIKDLTDALWDENIIPVIITGYGDLPDSTALLSLLKTAGMERLLIESPSYTSHLMQNGQLDEYFINYSMLYAGGMITPNTKDPFTCKNHPHSKLLTLATHGPSFLYTRQKLFYGIENAADLSGLKY